MGVAPYLSSLFQSCNKGGRMTYHVSRALDILFLLQIVHQPIVEGMRGFGERKKIWETCGMAMYTSVCD